MSKHSQDSRKQVKSLIAKLGLTAFLGECSTVCYEISLGIKGLSPNERNATENWGYVGGRLSSLSHESFQFKIGSPFVYKETNQ